MDLFLNDFEQYYKSCQNDLIEKYKKNGSNSNYYLKYDVELKTLQRENLYFTKFKYQDICKFNYLWQMASRGTTIIDKNIKNTQTIKGIFGLNKFFNIHEYEKIYKITFEKHLEILESNGFTFLLIPKYDGSYVQFYTDENGVRHRETLGSLERNKIGKSNLTYYDVSNKLLYNQYPKLYEFLDKNIYFSLVCEIMTPENKVKTKYDFSDDRSEDGILKPLVIIKQDGIPTFENLEEYFSESERWNFNFTNYNEIKENAIKMLEKNPSKFGICPEGLVVYACKNMNCFPIAKIKRKEYVDYDPTKENENLMKLQIAVIDGKIDDIPMTDFQEKYIEDFKEYLRITSKDLENYEILKNIENMSQKQYAESIKNLPNNLQIYSDSLFRIRRNGFELKNVYENLIQLLKLEIIEKSKKIKMIEVFQLKYGCNWFKIKKFKID